MGLIKTFKSLDIEDRATNKFQENCKAAFGDICKNPLLLGNRLTDLAISTATTKVEHKLGTEPLGYIVISQNANSVIWKVSQDDKYITFDCSVDVTIDLWVF